MKIECLTMRDGSTPVQVGKSGHRYVFQERRDALCPQDGPTTSVFDVQSEEHIEHLLKFPNFRKFDPKVPPPAIHPVADMANYYITKYVDGKTEGYICVMKSPLKYAGRDGRWVDSDRNITSFSNEMSAWEWLVDEAKILEDENKAKPKEVVEEKEEPTGALATEGISFKDLVKKK